VDRNTTAAEIGEAVMAICEATTAIDRGLDGRMLCHQVGDERRQEREVLGVPAQDAFGEKHEVGHAAGHLHRGDRRDHRDDDGDDVERQRAGRQPEGREDEHAEAAGEADGDAAEPGAEEDGAEHDEELEDDHRGSPTSGAASSWPV
jgi:hypothetical protein